MSATHHDGDGTARGVMDSRRRVLAGAAGTLVLSLSPLQIARGANLLDVRLWPAADYTRLTLEHTTSRCASPTCWCARRRRCGWWSTSRTGDQSPEVKRLLSRVGKDLIPSKEKGRFLLLPDVLRSLDAKEMGLFQKSGLLSENRF